jgi:hypothetical protein
MNDPINSLVSAGNELARFVSIYAERLDQLGVAAPVLDAWEEAVLGSLEQVCAIGTRVRLTTPHAFVAEGATGTVATIGVDPRRPIEVDLDDPVMPVFSPIRVRHDEVEVIT